MDGRRQVPLVGGLDGQELVLEPVIVGVRLELLQPVEISRPGVADAVGDQGCQTGITCEQPAAWRYPVSDGEELLRPQIGEILDDPGPQDLGVELGDAVDTVAADDGKVGHAQFLVAVLLEDRYPAQRLGPVGEFRLDGIHEAAVDLVNDLEVARDEWLHHRYRPGFQRFRQQGVVRVGAGRPGQFPGRGPAETRFVQEKAHQLRDGQCGVGVVELEGHLVREHLPDLSMALTEAVHRVPHRTSDQEILLCEAEPASGFDVVSWVEDPGHRLDASTLFNGLGVTASRENVEIELGGCARIPKPQWGDGVGAVARYQDVVRNAIRLTPARPRRPVLAALLRLNPFNTSAKPNRDRAVIPNDLPRVSFLEPGVGVFDLPAVFEVLAEHPVVVTQAVTVGGVVEGRQRIEEARCQPAETAVAETGVRLLFDDGVEVEAEHLHRLASGAEQAGGHEVVAHQPAEEVLHRQVVDHLRSYLVVCAPGEDFTVDGRLTDRTPESDQVVGWAGMAQFETAGVAEIVEKSVAKLFGRRLFQMDFRKHGSPCAHESVFAQQRKR